ncbi:TatD family hydrolase [Candidatus Latescibacterota bacterium]
MLVDTHAHLDFPDFDHDRDQVIDRARDAGVSCVINPGVDLISSEKAVALSERYGTVTAAVGIHPNSTTEASPGDMLHIARLADHPNVVAIGETGLDFYRDRSPRETQVRAFRAHLGLAREMNLPVIIHFRNVESEGITLTGKDLFDGLSGVFHCFSGSLAFAEEILAMGFLIGFDGPLTYPKSDRALIACEVPLERCLLETDAPFLAPQAHRGKRNEPAYVCDIAAMMADIRGCTVDEVIATTGENARVLFGLDDTHRTRGENS